MPESDDTRAGTPRPPVPPDFIDRFAWHLEPAGHALDAHQDTIQRALEASGAGWVSTTRLRGTTWLRAGILNTRATESDVEGLLDTLRELAIEVGS